MIRTRRSGIHERCHPRPFAWWATGGPAATCGPPRRAIPRPRRSRSVVRRCRDPPGMSTDATGEPSYERQLDRLGMRGYRYGFLLLMILTSLVFQLAAPDADWARVVTIVIQGLTLVLALVVSRVHPWAVRLATVTVCVAIVSSLAALIGFGTLGPTAGRG